MLEMTFIVSVKPDLVSKTKSETKVFFRFLIKDIYLELNSNA